MKNNKCLFIRRDGKPCGKVWLARVEKPVMCPRCKSQKWNTKKKEEKSK